MCLRQCIGETGELDTLLIGRVDHYKAAPFLGRNIGKKRRPAIDGERLGAGIAA